MSNSHGYETIMVQMDFLEANHVLSDRVVRIETGSSSTTTIDPERSK